MRKIIEAFVINESAKNATPVDKYETDISMDSRGTFYYKGSKLTSVEMAEDMLRYINSKGILVRWELTKEDMDRMFETVWKAVPNNYHISYFGERGLVVRGIKKGKNIVINGYYGTTDSYDGVWYLKFTTKDRNTFIFSENELPDGVEYSDISGEIGKKHNFPKKDSVDINGGKKIQYDDDTVIVYQNGKEVYKGLEDYEPMKRENWKWDNKNKYYIYKDYIKVCH